MILKNNLSKELSWAGFAVILLFVVVVLPITAQHGEPATISSSTTSNNAHPADDATPLTSAQIETSRAILSGFSNCRQSLRRGSCQFSGTRDRTDKASTRRVWKIEGFSEFDLDQTLFHFERRETSDDLEPIGGRYIRTKEMVVKRDGNSRQITILNPQTRSDRESPWLRRFDIRTAGAVNDAEFESNVDLDGVLELLPESKLIATANEDGLHRLTWFYPNIQVERTIWFDDERNYWPVRMELRIRNAASPIYVTEVVLIKRSDVYVPHSIRMRRTSQSVVEKVEYDFRWYAVNKPINAERFRVESMRYLGEQVRIVNMRGATPVVLESPYSEPRAISESKKLRDTPPKGSVPFQFNGQTYYFAPLF